MTMKAIGGSMTKLACVVLVILVNQICFASIPGVTDSEIVIGAHTAESGWAPYVAMPAAMTAYFEKLNAAGGIFGRKVKFNRIDCQADALKVVQATKKLVEEDGVFALVGAVGPTHQGVYRSLQEKGVPDMFIMDGLSEYTNPAKKWIFQGILPWAREGKIFGDLAVKKFKGKRACLLVGDNAVGEEFLKGAKGAIEEGNASLKDGEKVVIGLVERVDKKAPQVNAEVLKLKKDGCDLVLTSLYARVTPTVLSYAASQSFKPTFMVTAWNVSTDFLAILPESVRDGVIAEANFAFADELGGKVSGFAQYKSLMKEHNITLGQLSGQGYAVAEMFAEVLKRAGKDLSREKLVEAAESLKNWKCSICFDSVNMSATNHVATTSAQLIVSKSGKWVSLE